MPSPQLKLREINSLRLSRDSIQKWLPETRFPDIIKGLYCRVVVRDKESNKVYKIARVSAIHSIRTDEKSAVVTVAVGRQQKEFSLDFVSNGSFTEDELSTYRATMEGEGLRLVTPAEITNKIKEIKVFVNSTKAAAGSKPPNEPSVSKRRADDGAAPAAKRAAPERAVAAHGDARSRRLGQDNELLRRKVQDLEVRLLKERERADKLDSAYKGLQADSGESNKLLQQLHQQVKGLGDQQAAVKRKERQIEEMRYELERLQTEVSSERDKCEQQQRAVKAEQEGVRLRLLKIKEMDMVIKAQEEILESQREIAEAHMALSRAREEHLQQLRAKNKEQKKGEREAREEVKRLRAELDGRGGAAGGGGGGGGDAEKDGEGDDK